MKKNNTNGYAGSIKNTGAQKVTAPFANTKKSKPVIKKGNDLRVSENKK